MRSIHYWPCPHCRATVSYVLISGLTPPQGAQGAESVEGAERAADPPLSEVPQLSSDPESGSRPEFQENS